MFCGNCGAELPAGARFCAKCGTAVKAKPAASQPHPQAQQRFQQSSAPMPPIGEETVLIGAPTSAPANGPELRMPPQDPSDSFAPLPYQASPSVASPVEPPVQAPAKKSKRTLVIVIVGILCGLAISVGIYFGIRASTNASSIQVVIPLEVSGLDEDGTRVPVQATGKDEGGTEVDVTAYLDHDGSGLSLARGTYEVKAVGSPISAKGVVYRVPDTVIELVLDDEAVGAGKTSDTSEPLTFEAIDAVDLTDEQIDEALEWAKKDEDLDAERAEELADLAREARDEAKEEADAKAKEEAEAKAKEEAEAAQNDAASSKETAGGDNDGAETKPEQSQPADDPDREANTIQAGNISFVVPMPWRGVTTVNNFDNGANVLYGDVGSVLSLQAGSDPYWLQNEPSAAFELTNGGKLEVYTQLDDGGVAGRFTDAEGRTCDLITTRFDGMESGGSESSNSAAGREAQALVTGLDPSSEPEQLAFECLHVCAENVTLS